MKHPFVQWFKRLSTLITQQNHRCFIVLNGSTNWIKKRLQDSNYLPAENESKSASVIIFSNAKFLQGDLTALNYRKALGSENEGLVFFDQDFNIDALAALSGTITAGNVCFILIPTEEEFEQVRSNFKTRFIENIKKSPAHFFIEEGNSNPSLEYYESAAQIKLAKEEQQSLGSCITNEQKNAVRLIEKVVTGHRNRPLVLTADRGRGKSSALAIAAAELMQDYANIKQASPLKIIVTAPDIDNLSVFFKRLAFCLPEGKTSKSSFTFKRSSVIFIPVDRLTSESIDNSVLLVDEAAAIPVYQLKKLLSRYHRTVFASTVHGYEGAGRGFTLKFYKILDTHTPDWKHLHIEQPIRWAKHDPLEQFMFDTCLLKSSLSQLPSLNSFDSKYIDTLKFQQHRTQQLLENETLLNQLFATLVTAHYQTKPSDLKLILDNANVRIFSLCGEDGVLAVALGIAEGRCDESLVNRVKDNQRRLKDQFLPQSLLTHCGIENAFEFKFLRIVRIAVHPNIHAHGIGSLFLDKISKHAERDYDYLGASFGANKEVLNYWLQNEFKIARIGFKRDKASGEHSALVIKALETKNSAVSQLFDEVDQAFYRSFSYLLTDEYSQLAPELVWLVLHFQNSRYLQELPLQDKQAITDFATKRRLYSNCAYSLHLWLIHHSRMPFDQNVLPLIERILQKQSVATVCEKYGFTGKKALNQHLVDYVQSFID